MTSATNGTAEEGRDTRFGGLAAAVEKSIASSIDQHLGALATDFPVTPEELSILGGERTRAALIGLLKKGVKDTSNGGDVEQPSSKRKMQMDVLMLIDKMLEEESKGPYKEHSKEEVEANKNADIAANVLTSVLLKSSPEIGIDPREVESRRTAFGSNAITEKQLESFCSLCFEAVQDFVLLMLIVLGTIGIVVETTVGLDEGEKCGPCWAEGAAILVSVVIVVNVTAGIDYVKQFAFIRLTRSLHETNTKQVIRDGKQVSVVDDEIVVGDILSVNSHSLASIPADCVLLGPASDLKMDESTLTGESKAILKRPGDVILSGTTAIQGSGKMVVIAVGVNSVAGKIKARVYEAAENVENLEGEDENSPLFVKLDLIAKQIGAAGTVAAVVAFASSCIIGLAFDDQPVSKLVDYLVVAITVLAVAVPEGLPLAVTLSLAFSSSKMMKDMNLVKHLDACETMGCATTICTDKTGTLRRFCRALLLAKFKSHSLFFA
jgi:P-type Ca2+ transporter type 2B